MNKKESQLFQAIDTAYNDPEMATYPEIRCDLLLAAQNLQNGQPYQIVAVKLKRTITRYVLLNHLQMPAAVGRLFVAIGPMGERYDGEATVFSLFF
ncbi:bacteriocin immunity protein [Lacticaseibacillus chiayiensis]|uniref:Bacteriocin immunity protein n=1 Tax=Lacticaseibacillus chiayiensis TaxID=2100821 RepID=A0A4Q1TQ29_9LACO|nr:bacteriocin immunity protein [Lacticaseibacillus chiayiensis]RXT20869.1 bacteriocin immunity protein [Lacticaseibacillus chiayiensis]